MSESGVFSHLQLHNQVSEHIRNAILRGEISPNEWIRQQRIADQLGVSQMPVREALKKLAAEGLVEHIPYRGARVVRFSVEDIEDLYAQRALLESRAARAATHHLTREDLDDLNVIQTQLEQNLSAEDIGKYRELNRSFHQAIYRKSQRNYLIRALDQLWLAFPSMLFTHFLQTSNLPLPSKESTDIQEHRKILAALEAKNDVQAEKAVYEHIITAGNSFTALLKANKKGGEYIEI
jgi:DNA-binding GntR family transcriptional regulator